MLLVFIPLRNNYVFCKLTDDLIADGSCILIYIKALRFICRWFT